MSDQAASFQAASAFFGVGFTTHEAEMVVNHPVRRKIVLHLIIAGNVGITSALATLIVTFVQTENEGAGKVVMLLGLIVVGASLLYVLSHIGPVRRSMDAMMKFSLARVGAVRAVDYDSLLNVQDGFLVSDVHIDDEHPLAEMALKASRPSDHGIVILGIHKKDGSFVGAPGKHDHIHAGDRIMVYGSEESVDKMAHPVQDKGETSDES
ncbi:MAG: TrkA C-terminal domain-containing protein [Akkermansiaceae bacterium]